MVGLRAFFTHLSARARPRSFDRIEPLCRPTALPVLARHHAHPEGPGRSRVAPAVGVAVLEPAAAALRPGVPTPAQVGVVLLRHAAAPARGVVVLEPDAVALERGVVTPRRAAVALLRGAAGRVPAARRRGDGRKAASRNARQIAQGVRTAQTARRAPTAGVGRRGPVVRVMVQRAADGPHATAAPIPPAGWAVGGDRVATLALMPVSTARGVMRPPATRLGPGVPASAPTGATTTDRPVVIDRTGGRSAAPRAAPKVAPRAARRAAPTVAPLDARTTVAPRARRGWRRGVSRSR